MTVTAAWKVKYTWLGKFELCAHGPKVTIAKIDASTVWSRIAFLGTLVRGSTLPSPAGIRRSSPETKSSRLNE